MKPKDKLQNQSLDSEPKSTPKLKCKDNYNAGRYKRIFVSTKEIDECSIVLDNTINGSRFMEPVESFANFENLSDINTEDEEN